MKRLLLVFVICSCTFAYSQAFSCPTGTEDMMQYFMMGSPQRDSSHMTGSNNPIYASIVPDYGVLMPAVGYFVWAKSSNGHPWDIKAFDKSFVYDRSTELIWGDATSFKRFDKDLPISPRCVPLNGPGAPIKVPAANTNFSFYGSCQRYKTDNLGYVVNTISKPDMVQTDGNLGKVLTRSFNYMYSCDSGYSNCNNLEVFSLGYKVGLYDWKHYKNEGGKWVLAKDSDIDMFEETC